VKARRSAGTIAAGVLTCSRHFVTCAKLTAALKAGCTQVVARDDPPGITISGTPSENAWATAPNEFSTPGPPCMQNTPTCLPEVKRLIASAMWMPVRSWRTITGLMPAAAADSISGLSG
jgi:hypothetical protein